MMMNIKASGVCQSKMASLICTDSSAEMTDNLVMTLWYWMCTFLTAYLLFISLSKAWMHFQLLFDDLDGRNLLLV